MVMAQGLFKLIKQHTPAAIIDVLAPAWTFSLLRCMPEVNQAIETPLTHGDLQLRTRYQIGKSLRGKYDQAIVLQNSFKSALIPWFANIPIRTGWVGEFRYGLLNDARKLDKSTYPLMIEQYLALGLPSNTPLPAAYPTPEFVVNESARALTLKKINPLWRGKPVLALGVGAAFGPSKRWPDTYFADVAKQKISEGWDVWLFGSSGDKPLTETVMRMTDQQCDDLSGRTELNETIDLLSCVSGVVTNDSGLMHMAAALKKPLIAVYGSTSTTFTPPLSQTAQIAKLNLPCQPCFKRECPLGHHRCMRDLLPAQVLSLMTAWGK